MTYANVQTALSQSNRKVRVKFEVRDVDEVTWVDLSDRFSHDRLVNVGSGLTARQERETGAFDVQLSTITVWNGDSFWASPPPSDLFDATTWKRLRCRVSLVTLGGTEQLGIWVVDKVTVRANQGTATITLKTLTSLLVEAQADRVRRGKQWFVNMPSGFLVRRLLETRHKVAEVAAFTGIEDSYQIPIADSTREQGPVLSPFARPPETARDYEVFGNPIAVNNNPADAGYGDVWIGLEEELWKFDPSDGTWTYWTKLPADLIAAGAKIHHVFVSTLRQKVIALAWVPEFPSADVAARIQGNVDLVTEDNVCQLHASMTAAPAAMTKFGFVSTAYATGLFHVRAGRVVSGTQAIIGAQGFAGNPSGVNMPNPTPHWKRSRDPGGRELRCMGDWNVDTIDATEDAAMLNNASTDFWLTEPGRYHSWIDHAGVAGGPRYPANYRHSFGQYAGAFAFNEATDELVLTTLAWDGGLSRYKSKIVIRNINTGVLTDPGYYVMSGNEHYQAVSMEFNAAGNKLLVTGTYFEEANWSAGAPVDVGNNQPVGSIVAEFTWPLAAGAFAGQPAQTLHFLSTNYASNDARSRRRWLLLEAKYGATGYAGVTFIDYTKIGGACWGAALLTLGGGGATSVVRWSTGRQSGLCHWNAGGITAPGALFWQDAGANCLVRIPDDGTGAIVTVDEGFPPVDGDVGLAAGLVFSAAHNAGEGAIFGISGPGTGTEQDPDVQNPPFPGKFYLYQLAFTLTDRIELADFTDMTVWDALSALAAIADFVFGYDANGQFFFRLREAPTTALGTIKTTPNVLDGEIAARDATRDWGYDEVFNYAEVSPSRVILAEPKGSVQLLARPEGWVRDTWNGQIAVVQRSLLRQKIDLKVVEGGKVGAEDDGCIAKDRYGNDVVLTVPGAGERRSKLRLAWLGTDSVIETQLLEPWEAAAGAGAPTYSQARIDAKNFNTGFDQDVSNVVFDEPRGKIHVAWTCRDSSGSSSSHNRTVLFRSMDATTGAQTAVATVNVDQSADDFEAIGLELLADGTLLCGYGTFSVKVAESTDGGANWTVYTADAGSTRAFCGFLKSFDGTIVDVITQERGGGSTLNDVYQRRRTGAGTWGTQVKIHDSGSGASPWFDFRSVAESGPRIGYLVDANVGVIVGDYSNASNQHDQVRALTTSNGWAATATVLIADYTGTNSIRNPIFVPTPGGGRAWAAWVHTGDLVLSYTDDNGGTWSTPTAPATLAAVPWVAGHDRAFTVDEFGGLYATTFDDTGGTKYCRLFRGDSDGATWDDLTMTGLADVGDDAGVGDVVLAGTDLWRVYTVLLSGHYELHYLKADDVVEDPTAGLKIVVPYIAALDTTRGLDESSFLSTVNGELYGDSVEIGTYVGTVRDITHDPTAGTSEILLDHSPSDLPYPIGTRVVIRSWENNAWSDGPLGIARTADPSGSVTPGAEGVETDYEAISTRNMTVGMIARPHVDDSGSGDPDLLVTAIQSGTTWTGRRVGTGGDTDDVKQYRPIRGYLAPVQNDEYPAGTTWWIGPTGVGLIFEIPEGTTRGVIQNGQGGFAYAALCAETPFMVGDEIHIDCEGLKLDSQELAKQIAVARESIEKYGVSIFRPARRSPFLNYARAREMARRVVAQNSGARYMLDVDLPLTFVPHLGDCYLIEDPRILKWTVTTNPQGDPAGAPVVPDTARAIAATVRSFTLDPVNGTCKVTFRAVNQHAY